MPCCICSHDVRLVDGLLQLHCPFYFSLSLYSSQPASSRCYCIKKTNRVAAKFRYKAKDVGQPPWLGWQGCQGDGGGKGRLDKGQCLMHAKCAPRTHFFMAAQLRGAAAERTKTMLPMKPEGRREGGGGKRGKCLRY